MRQPTIMDLFDKIEIQESNNEIKEIVENETVPENANISDVKEVINNSDGIVEIKYGNENYKGEIKWSIK